MFLSSCIVFKWIRILAALQLGHSVDVVCLRPGRMPFNLTPGYYVKKFQLTLICILRCETRSVSIAVMKYSPTLLMST